MEQDRAQKQGTPNWTDLATTDVGAAEAFYASVFGWTSEHMPSPEGGAYSIQRLDGKMVAAIYELDERLRGAGVPPHWGTYLEVDDVGAALERVKSQGGVLSDGPFEVPGVGEIAVIQDPTGAHLRIWHSAPGHCAEIFNVPGAMIWNELQTDRPEDAARFYAAVLGVETETTGPPMNYTTWKVDGRSVAGILKTTPEMGDFPSTWSVYFGSDDVDRTVGLAVSAGGTAIREPFDIPQVGRMAVVQDPQGAVFEVIRMSMSSG